MVDAGVVKYLKEGIAGGHSIESLKSELIKSGWSSSEVNAAAHQVEGGKVPPVPKSLEPTSQRHTTALHRPKGVRIAANTLFFVAVMTVVQGIYLAFVSNSFFSSFGFLPPGVASAQSLIFLIVPILIAIIPFVVGRNILRRRRGDRKFAIVISWIVLVVGILNFTLSIFSIINLLAAIVILRYLSFDKEVKEYFKK